MYEYTTEDKLKVGDIIKDIEDGDCYFIGIVENIIEKEIYYRLITVFWNGEMWMDDPELGHLIQPRWWQIEKLIITN